MRHVLLILAVLASVAASASGQTLSIRLESPQVYAGLPFRVEAVVEGDVTVEPRPAPESPGVRALGASRSGTQQRTTIVNGRRSDRVLTTLVWEFVADEPGLVTVGPLEAVIDGQTVRSDVLSILVNRLASEGLVEAEIETARTQYWLGEPIELVLRLTVRRYEDERYRYRADARDTWSWIEQTRSRFGPFSGDRAEARAYEEDRLVGGETQRFIVFEIRATVRPTAAGPLELEPVRAVMRYPVRLQPARSLFSAGDLEIAESRLVVGTAEPPAVEVRTPPEEGRPGWYTGAVGRFAIEASALPLAASVGDPITLAITVRDRSTVPAALELLRAPPLDDLPTLVAGFRVPNDPLAGEVRGREKVFTQTIRPRSADVEEIPAIPFAYFDPEEARYVTVFSNPIPLAVAPAAVLPDEAVVGGAAPADAGGAALVERAGGLRANERGPDLLETTTDFAIGAVEAGTLAAGPAMALAALVVARRRRSGVAVRRRRRRNRAGRDARRRLDGARRGRAEDAGAAIGPALVDYVRDRLDLDAVGLTGRDAAARLRERGAAPATTAELESICAACEAWRYGGGGDDAETLVQRAESLLAAMEAERW